jgi:type IV pilus assembly protein PilQ
METMKHTNRPVLFILLFFLTILVMSGCAATGDNNQDAFFKEWKAKVETSHPYLPERKNFSKMPGQEAETSSPGESDHKLSSKSILKEKELLERLPSMPITVRFVDDKLATVLRTLARLADQNILLSPSVQGIVNVDIKDTPWNKVFMSIVANYGLIATKEANLLHVMSLKDMQQQIEHNALLLEEEQVAPLQTELITVEYSDPEKIAVSLALLLSKDKDGKARGSVSVDTHSRSLIIRDSEENMNRLLKLVYDLDQPTPQILIQAHIIETTKDTARELGVQWGANTNPGSSRFGDFSYSAAADFLGQGATFGVLGTGPDLTLDVTLSALQSAGKINILSSPSIATLDNNEAVIESGSSIPVQSGKDKEGNLIYTQTNATLKLTVTPHVISPEQIKLDILAQKDEVGGVEGDLTRILKKNAQTKLIVPNSATVVIAGLTKEKNINDDEGVPFLMDLPLVGGFFKNNSKSSEFEDLLIFITPTILTKPTD